VTKLPVNRDCPITGRPAGRVLGYVPASVVAAENPTYRDNFAQILGISPDDEFPFVEGPTGFVYAGWAPPDEFLRRVYEDVIDHSRTVTTTVAYRQSLLEFAAAFFQLVAPRVRPGAPLKLLDFGCGYGALLNLLASRDIESMGFEPSSERGRQTTADGRFPVLTSIDDLVAAGPFDLFVCTEVLEHVPDPRSVLRLFKSLAAPNALLALTVPQCERPQIDEALGMLAKGSLPGVYNPWEHLNYFDAASLHRLLAEEGFEVVRDFGAAGPVHEAAARVGAPAPFQARLKDGARMMKRAVSPAPSTQLFCRAR
jgi:SAM-dependent methyltransferase